MANETLEQLGNALEAAQQKIGAVAEEVSEQAYNELVAIRREKLRGLQEAGNDPFELTSYPQADFAAEVKESFVDVPEGEQGRSVCMAGRMMSKRVMGKASFADLRDTTGNIQLYVRRDDVGVEEYQAFKKFDIGDIIVIHDAGAHGFAMGFNYNGKLRSAELLLKPDGKVELIRRAETIDDYLATLNI